MTPSTPTFHGLENVARHLRQSFDEIASVVVERVINRNDNDKVAAIELSPEALRAFLPPEGSAPTSDTAVSANGPQMGKDEQREAMLAWLRLTFAANAGGAPTVKYKVGLWRPKREALVGSVRVNVCGLPSAPVAADVPPPAPVQTWELVMPNGERFVTSNPDIVDAHRHLLESSVRGMIVFTEQVGQFLGLVAQAAETDRRQQALEAKIRRVCDLPPDHDWSAPKRSNILPFSGSPKP